MAHLHGLPQTDEPRPRLDLSIDLGIDNRERRYFGPNFDFTYPLEAGELFLDIDYHQWMNGRLQGRIDYWLSAGYRLITDQGLMVSLRLNHLCRHEALRQVDQPFDLNEVMALVGLAGDRGQIRGGGGFYLGGHSPYQSLVYLGLELARFPLPELTFEGEVRWVDFCGWVHDAGLYLNLSKGTQLFLRNTGQYRSENMTLMGLRLSTREGAGPSLDGLGLNIGVSPDHRLYKIGVDGRFRLEFFARESSRLLFEFFFYTPLLNGDTFFARFQPDRMVHGLRLEYQKALSGGWQAYWYGQYRLDQPVDRDEPFEGDLGTGLGLRNQTDFLRLERRVRFDLSGGFNFKKGPELSASWGLCLPLGRRLQTGLDLLVRQNNRESQYLARFFLATGAAVSIRPFFSYDRYRDDQRPEISHNRFSVGLGLFTWSE
jgi:hypothetical protein